MSRLASHINYAPVLLKSLGDNAPLTPPSVLLETRTPSFVWPQLDSAAQAYAAVYQNRSDVMGSFKRIGRAHALPSGWIKTTTIAWEFQGWLPFASRKITPLSGAFAELNFDVAKGEITVAVLGDDGSQFVGRRYVAGPGNHHVHLPILSNEVKGVVFANHDSANGAEFRIRDATVLMLDRESDAFAQWNQAVIAAEESPQAETPAAKSVVPSPPLVAFHLLSQGRLHDVRALLHAARNSSGQIPSWFPARLDEFVTEFIGMATGPEPTATAGEEKATPLPSSSLDENEHPALREVLVLRPLFAEAPFVPLQYELLELALMIDLIGITQNQRTSFQWQRTAIAGQVVPRGLLRNLLDLVAERLNGDLNELTISATSAPEGTSIKIQSQLQNGDLQYRDFSTCVAAAYQTLNHAAVSPPHLVHRLGQEKELELQWSDPQPAHKQPDLSNETPTSATTQKIYHSETGGEIQIRHGLCYKSAPAPSSKPNSLVAEAELLQEVAQCAFVPRVAASRAWANSSAMSYRYVDGMSLEAWNKSTPPTAQRIRVLQQLSDAISTLNRCGIQHRDLRAENIVVKPDQTIAVLDFDQARRDVSADDFSNEWDAGDVCSGFGGLLKQLGWQADYLRSAGSLALAWELGKVSAANSPGNHSCYYAWQWGPLNLIGERPWTVRWQMLQQAFPPGKPGTLLELGCNLGLLSTYAALAGWEATGLDHDEVAVEAADLIATTLCTGATFAQADLTNEQTFQNVADTYDMVSALSVLHWLPDPAPVERFLRRQSRLLFEGHRSLADETAYLNQLGFENVELLGYSERLRPVLLATTKPTANST